MNSRPCSGLAVVLDSEELTPVLRAEIDELTPVLRLAAVLDSDVLTPGAQARDRRAHTRASRSKVMR